MVAPEQPKIRRPFRFLPTPALPSCPFLASGPPVWLQWEMAKLPSVTLSFNQALSLNRPVDPHPMTELPTPGPLLPWLCSLGERPTPTASGVSQVPRPGHSQGVVSGSVKPSPASPGPLAQSPSCSKHEQTNETP